MQSFGLIKDKPAVQLAEYILYCYKMSKFCDLNLVASGRENISCHKLVLCSLSTRLRSICLASEDAGDITYIHLPEFTHKEVRDVVDKIYENIGRSKVEMERSEVTTVLGIESTPLRHKNGSVDECTPVKHATTVTTSVKVEAKYSDEEPDDTSNMDDFLYSDIGEPFEGGTVKHEVDENLGEDVFHEKRHSRRRRRNVVRSRQYKEDSDFEMDDDNDNKGDEDFAHSSSDDDVKPRKMNAGDHPPGSMVQFNEYTGTRKEFWRENFVKDTLKVSTIRKTILHKYSYLKYFLPGCPEARNEDD